MHDRGSREAVGGLFVEVSIATAKGSFHTCHDGAEPPDQIKSADQIELMKQAGSRSDAGFMELIKRRFVGRSEIGIHGSTRTSSRRRG